MGAYASLRGYFSTGLHGLTSEHGLCLPHQGRAILQRLDRADSAAEPSLVWHQGSETSQLHTPVRVAEGQHTDPRVEYKAHVDLGTSLSKQPPSAASVLGAW